MAENNNGDRRESYRKLAEHETKALDQFSSRLSHVEADFAATRSDIKSLYNYVEKIGSQLDRIVDRTRPNTLALFGSMVSLVALVAVIGGLAFAPVYRTLDTISITDRGMEQAIDKINSTRFTPDDARELRGEASRDMEVRKREVAERFYRNENLINNMSSRLSGLEGSFNTHQDIQHKE